MPFTHALFQKDRYGCPDHFTFERHHPLLIAAWATALLALIITMAVLALRPVSDGRSEVPDTESTLTSASIR